MRNSLCHKIIWLVYFLHFHACAIMMNSALPTPPTPEELEEFRYITTIHKHLVKYLGELFNGADYTDHDNSKFRDPEITPYTLRFIRMLRGDQNPKWEEAKLHHFHNNNHHIEYWKHHQKPMPMERLVEAVVDMMAAKFQYQLNPGIVEEVRIDRYTINHGKLIEHMREYLRKPEMYVFLDRFLTEYDEDQKRIINQKLNEFKRKFNAQDEL